ncbi:MAG: DUF21 domain-containing protein [Candidatus Margulisbacteria bacterium]|nr:DUF21 domain-containing protein [Candidatus Margulisiibacteriota bacterium]
MGLLIIYASIALGISFLCSILEVVILSVQTPFVATLVKDRHPSGKILSQFKKDIHSPLAAILTLNTIAHTMGAAGVGMQAALVFKTIHVGVISGILTFLILYLSEIIPKTLGAHYWKGLAPISAYTTKLLIWLTFPFVVLAKVLMRSLPGGPTLTGFSRKELEAAALQSARAGKLNFRESRLLRNVITLREIKVQDVMTPKTVVFSLPEQMTVQDYYDNHHQSEFSRIPIYQQAKQEIVGFVLHSDLILAFAQNQTDKHLTRFKRDILTTAAHLSLVDVLEFMVTKRAHIVLVVDEYGTDKGIITLEDILETLLGLEIVDETDKVVDMQAKARRLKNKKR